MWEMWELGKVGFPSFPKRGGKVVASRILDTCKTKINRSELQNQGIPKSHEQHTVISLPALQLCLGVDGHLDEDGVDGDCAAAVFVLS